MPSGAKPAPPQQTSLKDLWANTGKKEKAKNEEDASRPLKSTREDKMIVDGMLYLASSKHSH